MDIYAQKGKSIPRKTIVIILELLLIWLSCWIMFQRGGDVIAGWLGIANSSGATARRTILFIFSIIVFLRMSFMMLVLLKRRMPWAEVISVPVAFAVYYVGFPLLALPVDRPIDGVDYLGIFIFAAGSFINTCSELQRHFWKKAPAHKGRLYTEGLFRYSMHINYFGDLLWVSGYAILTRNWYAALIPALLAVLFIFFNIPLLDAHLRSKYKADFDAYAGRTRKFIPFIY
ncbi:DUF1295 domain-containing protein [Chitinophaga japonensis]|uniref:Steroid 5-alpha reductase family enzyme n=1 Tax=Chitinophaga japonensis TaxID=104662 RepID=A0A562SZP4_CHIJA|nr:DUF1295 domain-containing protein [Chitinophaga japonensis]TWI86759.1 steroid 5-alpha reductase family enzyme [Chitinophaga japonensis]